MLAFDTTRHSRVYPTRLVERATLAASERQLLDETVAKQTFEVELSAQAGRVWRGPVYGQRLSSDLTRMPTSCNKS